ncbi:MAG TPA: hypothetical protein VGA08_01380 [Candidatus Saccharimonadales bacterium]
MARLSKPTKFVDFVISEARPSFKKRLVRDYRTCSITRRGNERLINLRVPLEVQQRIITAYAEGKQVRIFA